MTLNEKNEGGSYTGASLPHIAELLQMHTYARPHGSATETKFCERYIAGLKNAYQDAAGNWIVRVGSSRILWSCHTDTVHREEGRTRLTYGGAILSLSPNEEKANCLGADCTVGVWLMRQMILRSVPGLYVFHAGEECGGIGSTHIAQHTPELLKDIDFAVALDRKGETSVVTHQWGGRCASDAFAKSFADQMIGMDFKEDSGGTFTDTANYTHLVSECSNISVGYYGQHTKDEVLDVGFAAVLLEQLCRIDESKLVAQRDPTAKSSRGFDDYSAWWERGTYYPSRSTAVNNRRYVDETIFNDNKDFMEEVTDLAFENPDALAEIFADYGIDRDVIREYVSRHNQKMVN